jgi:hypothetical protein
MSHFSRKCYSTVKRQLESQAGYSPLLLSEMDTGTYNGRLLRQLLLLRLLRVYHSPW